MYRGGAHYMRRLSLKATVALQERRTVGGREEGEANGLFRIRFHL